MSTLAIVGAGPRGTGLLERIAANAAELLPSDRPLEIHLVDPHPPGGGRIWRYDQSPLLRMNSMAEDVTMFTDASATIEGPVRPGPSLAEWATHPEEFAPYRPVADPAVQAELASLAPTDFPTRRAQSAYLDWVFRRAVADLPAHVTVTVHRDTARSVSGSPDGAQLVQLSDGVLIADQVVLTLGHLGSSPDPCQRELAGFAARHGRFHLPPAFSSDVDLSGVAPGEQLVLRGFGLAFVDLVAMLTEGRGGRFVPTPGGLTYQPSGREPVIHVGSRRGVPYHSKTGYRLQGPPAPLPRYFDAAAVDRVLADPGPLELRRDFWPLMAKEIGFGHYHELFHAHRERVSLPWSEFLDHYDRLDWYAPELAALVARAVPDPADRLDFEALDHPLTGLRLTPDQLQQHLRDHIGADHDRRADPAHSADLGAFLALLSLFGQLPRIMATGRLTARSVATELDGWWFGFFSFLASGPPGFRLRQLLALSEAGVVRFLGADLRIEPDERTGTFVATSPTTPGHRVHATALIEAYLPKHVLSRTEDPVLRGLARNGELLEESGLLTVSLDDGRLLDPTLANAPHPRRTALGPHTNGRAYTAFARPRTNAPGFRQNDAAARSLLTRLSQSRPVQPCALPEPSPDPCVR
ncbi:MULTISPECIES: FAD/NAD(P)-binding domain-containing protein [unclassified Kitasatospora]|uniref:FAD/NAD(P)-binding protein n=1 Tax=unclassified Kitasatospora TaxID=2633591 RepID=UPI00070D0C93|nr:MULTISPECIES: FAD/NAD(P)-binding protein [unclassified Kitasatospora]KQV23756.1 adenylate cyclase [Kitasatospora sp. Root107]KRB67531.1 adenylate cyclase [Kitasatospora sp. Root187]